MPLVRIPVTLVTFPRAWPTSSTPQIAKTSLVKAGEVLSNPFLFPASNRRKLPFSEPGERFDLVALAFPLGSLA
jgi:hypothetical protein